MTHSNMGALGLKSESKQLFKKKMLFHYELYQRLQQSQVLFLSHFCTPGKLPHPQNLCQPVSTNRESNTGNKMQRRAMRYVSKTIHLLRFSWVTPDHFQHLTKNKHQCDMCHQNGKYHQISKLSLRCLLLN